MKAVQFWIIMENYNSDSDFCLTQVPSTSYWDINSSQYGKDISEGNDRNQLISLESAERPVFDVGYDVSQQSRKARVLYDNVEIEDISDDSEGENM